MAQPKLLFFSNLFPDLLQPYRGLDNATVLHGLADTWDIKVVALRPSLRNWLPKNTQTWNARTIDRRFAPEYVASCYVPKIGAWFNHWLMHNAMVRWYRSSSEKQQYDVILTSWLYPDGWAASRFAKTHGVPLVLIAQGSDVHQYMKRQPRRRLILSAIGESKGVITRSRSLSHLIGEAGVPIAKLRPIANGVDLKTFYLGSQENDRKRLGVEQETKLLLFVGNLLPVKNPELLLRAFAKVAKDNPDRSLRLCLAGKGPLRTHLGDVAEELGIDQHITFLGPLDASQIAAWMRVADILCLSSRNEGLPNVILEAMACGLPVLATDVGGIHEILNEPWKGRLVPSEDLDNYAAALRSMLELPLDKETIANYGKTLSWKATVSSYQQFLENTLNGASEN